MIPILLGDGGFGSPRSLHPSVKTAFLENKSSPSAAFPQETGSGAAVFRHTPSRENGIAERPQTLRYPELKIYFPLTMPKVQRRRPPPAAETGRSCWGSGQQDARAAQGTMRMLGAATRAVASQSDDGEVLSRSGSRSGCPSYNLSVSSQAPRQLP